MQRRLLVVLAAALAVLALAGAAGATSLGSTDTLGGPTGGMTIIVPAPPTTMPGPGDELPPGDCPDCGCSVSDLPPSTLGDVQYVSYAPRPTANGRAAGALAADLPGDDGKCYHIGLKMDLKENKRYEAQLLTKDSPLFMDREPTTTSLVGSVDGLDVNPNTPGNKQGYRLDARVTNITTKNAKTCRGSFAVAASGNYTVPGMGFDVELTAQGLRVTISDVPELVGNIGAIGNFNCTPKQ